MARRKWVLVWVVAAGVAGLSLGICGYAEWAGHWRTDLPTRLYFEPIPHANKFTHS
jgi:hypothetical protein